MAYFPPHFIDELLASVPIKDLLGRYTKLQKRGNALVGLCPFHKEKTPSFHVNEQKGVYHCFGCGASGNAITFMTSHQGLSSLDAIKTLAEQYHVPLPTIKDSNAKENQDHYYQGLYATLESATAYFTEHLFSDHPQSRKARLYLMQERGLDEATLRHFQVGFAPEGWQDMIEALTTKGHSLEDMITLGLVKKREQKTYSFFRSRIMIPIKDRRNRTIAFGGRILEGDKEQSAKYMNSTNHPLFDKSRVLFQAQDTWHMSKDSHPLIVVEGYMDVIRLYQGGFPHAVASLGTAVTIEHLKAIWQKSSKALVCFDGDTAGQKATARLIEIALPLIEPEKTLKIARLPKDTDPDDLIGTQQEKQLQEILNTALPLSEWLWQHLMLQFPDNRPETLAALEQQAMSLLQTMHHETLRKHFSQFIRDKLWNRRTSKRKPMAGQSLPIGSLRGSRELRERRYHIALYIFLKKPVLLHEFSDLLSNITPSLPDLMHLQECLLEYMWTTKTWENQHLYSYLQSHNMDKALDVLYDLRIDRIIGQNPTLEDARQILKDIHKQQTLWLIREEKRIEAHKAIQEGGALQEGRQPQHHIDTKSN